MAAEQQVVKTAAKETFTAKKGLSTARIAELKPEVPARDGRTPVPLAKDDRYTQTAAFLESFLKKRATDPDNPWAIGHGMLALGPDLVLSNGRPAVDHLFETYAERFEVQGHGFVRFPRKRGSQRIEPHAALMLKAMTESGVSPDREVSVQGAPATVADLWRGVLIGSSVDIKTGNASFTSPNDMPWALQALTAWAPKTDSGDLLWEARDGTQMSLREFSVLNTTVLMAESQTLFDAMQAGAALEKRGQGVYQFTCGGAHLLQGTAFAVGRGYTTPLATKAMPGQVALMFWRLPSELKIYDDLMRRIEKDEHLVMLLVQRLKFTGHFLETMHKMAILGLFSPTPEQQQVMKGAADQVVLTVQAMQTRGVFDNLDALRSSNEQLYLDVIGDSAHALRGMKLALGEDGVQF